MTLPSRVTVATVLSSASDVFINDSTSSSSMSPLLTLSPTMVIVMPFGSMGVDCSSELEFANPMPNSSFIFKPRQLDDSVAALRRSSMVSISSAALRVPLSPTIMSLVTNAEGQSSLLLQPTSTNAAAIPTYLLYTCPSSLFSVRANYRPTTSWLVHKMIGIKTMISIRIGTSRPSDR